MILGLGEGGMAFDERLAGRLQAGPLLLTEVENRSPGRPRVGVGLSSGSAGEYCRRGGSWLAGFRTCGADGFRDVELLEVVFEPAGQVRGLAIIGELVRPDVAGVEDLGWNEIGRAHV